MQKVLTAAEMREVDRLTTERYGIPSIILMENAAHAVARVITEKLGGSVKDKSVLILCGKGNNGGDGAALARILWQAGATIEVVLFGKIEQTKGDARVNFDFFINQRSEFPKDFMIDEKMEDGSIVFFEYEDGEYFRKRYRPRFDPSIVVDAILGTGLTRPVDENTSQVLCSEWLEEKFFRDREFTVISIDMPSGLDPDREEPIGANASADTTVTFTAPKVANVLGSARTFNGELIIANIGTSQFLVNRMPSQLYLSEYDDVFSWLYGARFEHDSYKNKRGHALLIAGSETYSGAAVLAANGAARSGVGLVTVGTPRSSKDSVASRVLPEVMVRVLSETAGGAVSELAISEVDELLAKVDAVAIGCGLGAAESETGKFVRHFVPNRRVPTILDADALNLIAPMQEPPKGGTPNLILTPHDGEFMRLLGTDDKDVIKDRVAAVRDFAAKHNVILVLKGERVLIGEPGGKVVVNPTGNSGLGKAGNGDTLAGILAGFVAQAAAMKIDIFETVVAAVYIAGMAGDIAEKKFGKRVMTSSDVRECLADAFVVFEKNEV